MREKGIDVCFFIYNLGYRLEPFSHQLGKALFFKRRKDYETSVEECRVH